MWIIVIINNEFHMNGYLSVCLSAQMELVEVSEGMRLLLLFSLTEILLNFMANMD